MRRGEATWRRPALAPPPSGQRPTRRRIAAATVLLAGFALLLAAAILAPLPAGAASPTPGAAAAPHASAVPHASAASHVGATPAPPPGGLHLPGLILWPPAVAFLVPLVAGFAAMPWAIGVLAKAGMGQRVREEGPQSHLAKSGTPTAGGLAVIAVILLAALLVDRHGAILPDLGALLLGAGLGLADDLATVKLTGGERGLRARQKIGLQLLIGLVLGWWMLQLHQDSQLFPFTGHWRMGALFVPVVALALVASSNAFNLTDGSDGLAPGVMALVALFVALIARHLGGGHADAPLVRLMLATMGGLLAFLAYNFPPARVFLGGVGSEGIGLLIAATAISAGLLWLLPLLALVPVAETLSVIAQVYSFKRYGRRVLRMSPLHHHFQLGGWSEWRVAVSAWGVTWASGMFCLLVTRTAT
ncbi:MAG TPA: phospho-N-acetylmuramoyl-pentapeptide-transferase [Candidatus Dormibacteraeota bacterium]|nr:phospho-N-acetylmuramoyl-pentapeptide-transferase [Candidatus Dormibacteraeota bacterium]